MTDISSDCEYRASSSPINPAYRGCPILAVCGFSGVGKTTLIESILPDLVARGWKILVVKQDAHRIELDCEGKDTDRLFRAGADVCIRDMQQAFLRLHDPQEAALEHVATRYAADYDCILVEGHKSTVLPWKAWLSREDNERPPPEAVGVRRVIGPRDLVQMPGVLCPHVPSALAGAWRNANYPEDVWGAQRDPRLGGGDRASDTSPR